MKKRVIAVLTAAVLLVSAAGCSPAPVSEPPETTATAAATTTAAETPAATTQAAEPFTPREIPFVWSASMDHIIKSAQEYLGISCYLDVDWEKQRQEHGAYGPTDEEMYKDYIYIYPVGLLDAMRDDGVLPARDNIAHRLTLNLYRCSENAAALKADEDVWLQVSATRFNDINDDTGNEMYWFRTNKENLDSGLTVSGEPAEPGFAAETGDDYYVYVTRESERERLYGFNFVYGDDMLVSGILTIDTENIDDIDEKTLDDIRCFFEALGLKNPLDLDEE